MRATGIVRPIDDVGRVVLPAELRRTMGIDSGDNVEIFTDQNMVVLKRYEPACIFCGEYAANVRHFQGRQVCVKCREQLYRQANLTGP